MRGACALVVGVFAVVVSGAASAQTVRVSVATEGTASNGDSFAPAMSSSGRFIAFTSLASNLVAGDTNGLGDVFLRDRDPDENGVFDEAGAVSTVRISQRDGVQGNAASDGPQITPDGRYVFFTSKASTLFSFGQPPLAFPVVLRWERTTGEVVLVSRNAAGEPLNGASDQPAATADGNTVYFVTRADNVDGGDVGFGGLVVRRDIAQGTLARVSPPQPRGTDVFGHLTAAAPFVADHGGVYGYAIQLVNISPIGGETFVIRNGQQTSFAGRAPQLQSSGFYVTDTFATPSRVYVPTGGRMALPAEVQSAVVSRSGLYAVKPGFLFDLQYGSALPLPSIGGASFDAADRQVAYPVTNFVPNRSISDVVVTQLPPLLDADRDQLNDHWETAFGLLTSSAAGDNSPEGDPDHDGVTNAQEFLRGANPTGGFTRTFAEGSSSPDFFTTRYALVNPGDTPATVAMRLDRGLLMGPPVTRAFTIPARARTTLDSHVEGLDTSSFSAVFESNRALIADRLVTWGDGGAVPRGSHAERAQTGGATQWFLAEGSTVLGFQLFYLLQNPQDTAATATVRFLLPSGAPLVRTYDLPARSRTTIYVNEIPSLQATDVSAEITATQPIGVERSMYRNSATEVFALGHAASAVQFPSTTWYFAEGATGTFFDTYLLLANPTAQAATVQVEFLKDAGGTVTRAYTVPANARFSVYVDDLPGLEASSFGIRVTSDVAIVAERAMYWPGNFFDYYEAHVSAGATVADGWWDLAECEVGGAYGAETYVLIANTSPLPMTFTVRLLSETGETTPYVREITLAGRTRMTLPMSAFPAPAGTPAPIGRFGVEVKENGASVRGLVVEGAIYWSRPVQQYAAGANRPATRVP